MLSRRDIAQKRRAVERRGRPADRRGNVVVAGRDIRHQGTEHVERGPATDLPLDLHVVLNLIERHVAGPLDHDLAAFILRAGGQLTERLEFRDLRLVGGVGDSPGPKPVAQRKAHVVLQHNIAQIIEHLVQRILLVMIQHPFGQQRPAPADNPGYPLTKQR